MSADIHIVGAGLAGLLAGNMLRRSNVVLFEAQEALPNNHSAILRFRTNKVAQQVGIPFRKVRVFKAVHSPVNPVADALAYSSKVLGAVELRSVIDLNPADRFIGPPGLISAMAEGLDIRYSSSVSEIEGTGTPTISTIPMPKLMDMVNLSGPRPNFQFRSGTTIKAKLKNCDVFASIYYPHSLPCYRASITGDELVIEIASVLEDTAKATIQPLIGQVLNTFGLWVGDVDNAIEPVVKSQPYAKIGRLSDEDVKIAKRFMYEMTTQHGIYSLGRFATWRSGLLLDDVVDDVLKIEGWIQNGNYDLKKGN